MQAVSRIVGGNIPPCAHKKGLDLGLHSWESIAGWCLPIQRILKCKVQISNDWTTYVCNDRVHWAGSATEECFNCMLRDSPLPRVQWGLRKCAFPHKHSARRQGTRLIKNAHEKADTNQVRSHANIKNKQTCASTLSSQDIALVDL